ncbi:choice-of-anchor D domain-containing protein [Halobellus ordinarius]|uniref:choice-of-anchor D domain-containing protein n=1 Tax=Halobellus ordinarius TaxID=3075120 RepID=UPI0028804E07|nr:choice-of-anchor D domain-containing protein [Halobellus sp. ZY16]
MTSRFKKGAIVLALLMVTSVMVTGGVADALADSTEDDRDGSFPQAPYLNFSDAAHNPETPTRLDFTYNASGEVASPDDLALYVKNSSSGNTIASQTEFSALKGEETFNISADTANSNTTLNLALINNSSKESIENDTGLLIADSETPELTNAYATDDNQDGNVSDGDTVEVQVDVTDSGGSGVDAVYVTNASTFGAETTYDDDLGEVLRLSQVSGTTTYNDTFQVNASEADADGSYNLSILAIDEADNQNTTETNSLTLNTSGSSSESPAYINGTVTNNSSDAGVSGTVVEFEYAGPENRDAGSTTTDSNGNYAFEVPDASQDYEVIVNEEGYVFESKGPYPVSSGNTTRVDIPLQVADTFINGTVTNESDVELSDVYVEFEYADTGEFFKSERTDQDGNYSFAVPNASRNYTAIVNEDDYQLEVKEDISVEEESTKTVDFTLTKGALLTGTVTNSSGATVSNVDVYIINSSTDSFTDSATTNATGQYSARVDPGTYRLIIDDRRYAFKIKRNVSVSGAETTVDLQVKEAPDPGYLNGTVETADGTPVGNATVLIRDQTYSYYGRNITSSNGNFSIRTPSANYTVRVEPSPGSPKFPPEVIEDVSVPENGVTQLTVEVEQPGYISGVVENAGGPVSNAFVVAETDEGVFPSETDQEGRYNITAPPGTHTVSVFAQGQDAPSQTVEVTAGQTNQTDFTLKRTEITSESVEIIDSNGNENAEDIAVQSAVNQGLLLVRLVNESSPTQGEQFGPPRDLESAGVNKSTEVRINLTVTNYTPSSLLWGIDDADWSKSTNETNPNATDITVTGSPVSLQANFSDNRTAAPLIGQDPSQVDWPTGRNDRATDGRNQTFYFGLFDLSTQPEKVRDNLNGISTTTNAQRFSTPRVKNDSLRVWIAAPGRTVDGADHTGFYQATIPDAQLQEWNVTNPKTQLNALYKGSNTNFTVTETSDGARIRVENISYSAGYVEVEATDDGQPSISNASIDAGGDAIVNDDETVTVSAEVSDSGDDITTVNVDASVLGAGSNVSLEEDGDGVYSATITAERENAPNDGTYRLDIRANDSAGNVETAETGSFELDVWYPPEDQILTQTEDVEIWERSVLPLRADTADASLTVDNAFWSVNLENEGQTSLNKDQIGVYSTGSDISVTFDDSRAIAERELAYSNDPMDVKLVAARLETNGSSTVTNLDSVGDINELLTGPNANSNASFQAVSSTELDPDTGNASFTFTPDQSGQYVLLLASNESGSFVVDQDGNVSIDGQTTLIGVDQVMVQDGPSSVSTSSTYTAGNNISVTADTGQVIETDAGENVTHFVAVYDEGTFTSEEFVLNVEQPFDSISDNVTLEHSIETVNGVWVVRNDASLSGMEISETRRDGQFPFSEAFDILNNGTGIDLQTTTIDPKATWNSSATIVETDANGTVVVETNRTWPDDEYRLVHFATNENGTQIAASKTTVQIQEPNPSNVSVVNASVDPDEAFTNESVTVNVTLENTGDLEGSKTVNVTVDDTVVANASATVPGGTTKTISTQVTFDTPGEKAVTVVDTDTDAETTAGTVTVDPAIEVTDFSLNRTPPTIGEPVNVTATVENVGPNPDSTEVSLFVEGVEEGNKSTGTLKAGENTTVNFTYTFSEAGRQDVSVRAPGTERFDAVDVSRQSVELNITAIDPTSATIKTGETIEFNVTRENDSQPVENATVEVGTDATTLDSKSTDPDGTVSFTLDTSGEFTAVADKETTDSVEYAEDSVDVTVNSEADISVVDVNPLSDPVYTGDTVTVETTVENTGDLSGEIDLNFTFGDEISENKTRTLDGGETRVISFEATPETVDESATVAVNNETASVTVKEAAIASGFTPQSDTVTVGESLDVEATIRNRGSTNSTIDVNLTVAGQEVDNETRELTPGEEGTRTLTWNIPSDQSAGTVNVSINDLDNQTVTVERQTVPLDITAEPSPAVTNETVTFTVERTDGDSPTPVENANISIDGQTLTTDADGQNTTDFDAAGSYTATASKGQTPTTSYESDSVSITVNEPGNLTVTDTFLETTQAYAGDDVNVTAVVENTGGVAGSRTVNLTNDSSTTVLDNESTGTVSAGGQTEVTLTTTLNETSTLVAGNLTAGTVEVDEQSVVTDFTLNATAVETGGTVEVNATVENRGETTDDDGVTVTFYRNNSSSSESFTETTGSIDAKSTTTVTQNITFSDDVTYDVSVEDLDPQTVTVSDNVVDLNIQLLNSTPVLTGTELVFNVTRADDGSTVDATVDVAGQELSTGSDGLASTTISDSGTYTAVASKADQGDETYNSDSVTLTVDDPADITVTDAYRQVTQAYVNDTVTVEADVENLGDREGNRTINLTNADGEVLDNETVKNLAGGDTTTITLSTTFDEDKTGERTLSVGEATAGDVQIDPQTVVTDVAVNETSVNVGDDVEINVTVENRGTTQDVDYQANVSYGGSSDSELVTVDSGPESTKTVSFVKSFDEPGTKTVSSDGVTARSVTVSRNIVDLNITASPTTAATGEDVTFTVIEGESGPAVEGAEISVGSQTITTDSNGEATTNFTETGSYTAQAENESNTTTAFDTDSTSIEIREPGNTHVISTDLTTATPVYAGQNVTVEVELLNDGGITDTRTVRLNNSTSQLNSTEVELDPGESDTVTLEAQLNATEEQELLINGDRVRNVTVEKAAAVTDFSLRSDALETGDTLTVEATVENRGGIADSVEANLTVEDEVVESESVQLDAGTNTTATLTTNFGTNGTRTVSVNDLRTERVYVERSIEQLSLAVNTTEVTAGNPVQFTVTNSSGTPVDATVVVGDDRISAANGTTNVSVRVADDYTPTATKAATETTAYGSDSVSLSVTDPLAVTGSVGFDAVQASPDETDARPNSATRKKNVTITNDGGRSVALSSAEIVGDDADQFEIDSSFPSSVAPGESRTVTVAFAPTERADGLSASLQFRSDTPSNPDRSVALTGAGEAPAVDVNTTSLTFGDVDVDGSSATQTVRINNTGDRNLTVGLAPMGTGFSRSNSSVTITPDGSKNVTVTFDPTEPQDYGAPLTLSTNDPFQDTVTVRATGTGLGGDIEVSPNPGDGIDYDFGDVTVNENATTRILVESTGTQAINVTPSITGTDSAYSVDNEDEEITLAPDESRYLTVTLSPDSASPTGNLTLSTNTSAVEKLNFSANGLTPTAEITPDPDQENLTFGGVAVGGSTTESVTIENTGNATLEVDRRNAIPSGQPFTIGATSNLTVPAGETRSIPVTYEPSVPEEASTELTLETNDPNNGSVAINLTGEGERTRLAGDNASIDFGTIGSDGTAEATVELRNDGTESLTNLRVRSKSGDASQFAVLSSTLSRIEPGESTNVTIRYDPSAADSHAATVTFAADGAVTGSNTFAVSLSGEATPPDVSVDTDEVRFGYVALDDTANDTVTITNVGSTDTELTVTDVSADGGSTFTVTNDPTGETIGGGGGPSATVEVDFDPSTEGRQTATLTIETDDPDERTTEVTLTGVGAAADAKVDTGSIDFGDVRTDAESNRRTVTITNDGGADLSLDGASIDSEQFTIVDGLDRETLVPGASEEITVTAQPDTTGTQSGTLTISTDDEDKTVSLTANGIAPELTVTRPLDGTFGDVRVGSSARNTLTVENTGNATLVLNRPTISGSNDFTVVSGDSSIRLGPGGTTTYAVAYTPTSTGDAPDTTFTLSSASGASNETDLSGFGIQADASLDPSTVDFGDVAVGDSDSTTLTLENDGAAGLDVTGVSVTGDDAAAFSVSDVTTGTIQDSTTFTVSTSPSVRGSVSAQLAVETEQEGTLTATLGATATEPDIEVSQGSITFNRTRLGETDTATLEIRNTGNADLNVTNIAKAGANPGKFALERSQVTVPAQSTEEVEVTFQPTDNVTAAQDGTPQTAALVVQSNDTDERVKRTTLSGTGKTPALTGTDAVQFGATSIGDTSTRTVTITNDVSASADVTLETISVAGPASDEFDVIAPSDRTLSPGESASVTVELTPDRPGAKFASLIITTNDPRQSGKAVFLSNTQTIVRTQFGSVDLTYSNVNSGQQPEASFRRSEDRNASVIATQPTVRTDDDFGLFLESQASPFGDTAVGTDKIEPLQYVSVTKQNFTESELENSSLQFRVSKSALADADAPPERVTFYEYNTTTSSYQSLNATLVREERTNFIYQTETDHFSRFAIGVSQQADISVDDTSLSQSEITTDESATVDVTLENTGGADGQTDVELTLTGSETGTTITDTKSSVTVNSSETKTVTFTVAPDTADSYSVTVDQPTSVNVGTLTVEEPSTGPSGPSGGDDDDAPAATETPGAPSEPVSATVDLDETGSATVELSGSTGATGASVTVPETTGQTTIEELPDPPADTPETIGQYVTGVDIEAPDPPAGQTATVTITVSQDRLDELGVAADQLTIEHYRDGAWQQLETNVQSTGEEVTVSAPVTGFSPFAVTYQQQTATSEPGTDTPEPDTDTPEPDTDTPEPDTQTTTDTGTPGFGIVVAIIALLAAALLAVRRRAED